MASPLPYCLIYKCIFLLHNDTKHILSLHSFNLHSFGTLPDLTQWQLPSTGQRMANGTTDFAVMFVVEIVALVYVIKRGAINYTTNTIPQWASWCCGCFVFGRTSQLNASFPSTDRSQLQLLDGNCLVFFATALFGFHWVPMFLKRQDFRYQHRIKGNCCADCLVRIHIITGPDTDCTII